MEGSKAYSVYLTKDVEFLPDTVAAEILQNVRTIVSTRRGTVPLDRSFGLSWTWIDKPIGLSKMLFKAEVNNALELWEPRAKLVGIDFGDDVDDAMGGMLSPTLQIALADGVDGSAEITSQDVLLAANSLLDSSARTLITDDEGEDWNFVKTFEDALAAGLAALAA